MNEIILSVRISRFTMLPSAAFEAVDGDVQRGKSQNLGLVGESMRQDHGSQIYFATSAQECLHRGRFAKGRDLTKLPRRDQESAMAGGLYDPQSAMNALDPVYTVGEQIVEAIKAHSL